jgi:HJR/Mrr/RecB family endonuclease
MATIIIKRKSQIMGCAQSHNVYILNTFVGELKSGGVLEIPVDVGTHLLYFNSTMRKLGTNETFNVVVNEPDEIVALKTKFGINGYEIKYADNKAHLPITTNEISETEILNTQTGTPINKNMLSEKNSASNNFDNLDGAEFEEWCANLLRNNCFTNVQVTKTTGDQGVDILAQKNDIKYAIQCKCYSSNLGNSPIQEVHAGKSMYNCHVGVVMTNRHFTSGAKELAKATGVLLWDREKLLQMMSNVETVENNYVSKSTTNAPFKLSTAIQNDPKFAEAVELAIDAGKISTSLLQRRIEIGYGRAAKMIDQMEELGIVSKADGNNPRKILISREDYWNLFG